MAKARALSLSAHKGLTGSSSRDNSDCTASDSVRALPDATTRKDINSKFGYKGHQNQACRAKHPKLTFHDTGQFRQPDHQVLEHGLHSLSLRALNRNNIFQSSILKFNIL